MTRLLNPTFRDEQAASRYPFVDTATLTASTGVAITPDAFLDASLYMVGGGVRQYLSAIDVENLQVVVWVGDGDEPQRASGSFNPIDPPNNVVLLDRYDRPAGLLVSDPVRLAIFQTWGLGRHAFTVNATEFVASCVLPTPELCVRGIQLPDGQLLTGDVWLAGDHGIVVREMPDHTIRIDAVGDPLYARQLCAPFSQLFATPRFLATINGVSPDQYGELSFVVGDQFREDTILRIYPDGEGTLRIEAVGQTLRGNF